MLSIVSFCFSHNVDDVDDDMNMYKDKHYSRYYEFYEKKKQKIKHNMCKNSELGNRSAINLGKSLSFL